MPFVVESMRPMNKRRRDDEEDDKDSRQHHVGHSFFAACASPKQKSFYSPPIHCSDFNTTRKLLPISKRARIIEEDDHDKKRDNGNAQTGAVQGWRLTPKLSGPLLAPCHVCHRRPTKKHELDSFADCQACGERTCFVCIRECRGWPETGTTGDDDNDANDDAAHMSRSFQMDDADDPPVEAEKPNPDEQNTNRHDPQSDEGDGRTGRGGDSYAHRSVVCSRCCVEQGTTGEVVCLGCLSRRQHNP